MKGKIIGALIGAWFFNFPGFLLGLLAGHLYDTAKRFGQQGFVHISADQRIAMQHCFFETTFKLLGYLAKADGRISEAEVSHTEHLMGRMALSTSQRQEAIGYFKQGATTGFDLQQTLAAFNNICGRQARLKQTLISYLVTLALADGMLDAAEKNALHQIAEGLGIPAFVFEQLLSMIQAQASFHQQNYRQPGSHGPSPAQALETAYRALGIESGATDAEVKKAYRRLISENHPDKLIGQGMPEEMVKVATERSQEISSAYEIIQKSRGR